MDRGLKRFLLAAVVLMVVLLFTSRFDYPKSDYSTQPPTDNQIFADVLSGKAVALLVCKDHPACDYLRYPLEELSGELKDDFVLHKVDAQAYCYYYPKRCPRKLPVLLIFTEAGMSSFYKDTPKELLREYVLGYRRPNFGSYPGNGTGK